MTCPQTGGACFDVDCQLNGCQGDSIRRAMNQITIEQIPIPRYADVLKVAEKSFDRLKKAA